MCIKMKDKCSKSNLVLNPMTQRCIDINGGTFKKLFQDKGMDCEWRSEDLPKIKRIIDINPKLQPAIKTTLEDVHMDDDHRAFCVQKAPLHVLKKPHISYVMTINTFQNRIHNQGLQLQPMKSILTINTHWNNRLEKTFNTLFRHKNSAPLETPFSFWEQFDTPWFNRSNDYILGLLPLDNVCLLSFFRFRDIFYAYKRNKSQLSTFLNHPFTLNPYIYHGWMKNNPMFRIFSLKKPFIPYSEQWIHFMLNDSTVWNTVESKQKILKIVETIEYAHGVLDNIIKNAPRTMRPLVVFDKVKKADVDKLKTYHPQTFEVFAGIPEYILVHKDEILRRVFIPEGSRALFIAPCLEKPLGMDIAIGRKGVTLKAITKAFPLQMPPPFGTRQMGTLLQTSQKSKGTRKIIEDIVCPSKDNIVECIDFVVESKKNNL